MKAQAGLTLIELLLTVAVAGVLFGVAVPAFSAGLEAARASEPPAPRLASRM